METKPQYYDIFSYEKYAEYRFGDTAVTDVAKTS